MNYRKKTVNNKKIAEQALKEAKERERERNDFKIAKRNRRT